MKRKLYNELEFTDDFTKRIQGAVEYAKDSSRWEAEYMTYIQTLRLEREEGREEIILNMLERGLGIKEISQYTGLPEDKIRQIEKKGWL